MNALCRKIQKIYLTLLLFNTLGASFIWGINTLFLLDAGLSNTEAFSANAFFTAGMVIFEVPTGIVADMRGRRFSYLLGTLTLAISTFIYFFMWQMSAPFWGWAAASIFLGLGYTFFSGAVEAWLVDALFASGFDGNLEAVFAKGEIIEGSAMLLGSFSGGLVAQITNLGVPYMLRTLIFILTFVLALIFMKDIGFTPKKSEEITTGLKSIWTNSIKYGLSNPPVRWIMLTAPFSMGVMIYAFYAMQPYLLDLYGDKETYMIAGLAAALIAGAQIAGGLLVPYIRKAFRLRTSAMLAAALFSVASLAVIGLFPNFWVVISFLILFGLTFAGIRPVRQTYLNGLIPSEQRATVLSFDSLLGSSGGVVFQPFLGKAADIWNYPISYLISGSIQAAAIPFILLARREKPASDEIKK